MRSHRPRHSRALCFAAAAALLVARVALADDPPEVAPSLLAPGEGRVPLHLESSGSPQNVAVPPGDPSTWTPIAHHAAWLDRDDAQRIVCRTPCTLYVPPGHLDLYTSGHGLISTVVPMHVPAVGASVLLRSPTSVQLSAGSVLAGAGVLAVNAGALLLAVGLASQHSGVSGAADDPHAFVIAGAITLGVGVLLSGIGIGMITGTRAGIDGFSIGPPRSALRSRAPRPSVRFSPFGLVF